MTDATDEDAATPDAKAAASTARSRVTVRLDDATMHHARYLAAKRGQSMSEFIADAIDDFAARHIGGSLTDYDMLTHRVGELIDETKSMRVQANNHYREMSSTLRFLTNLARGDEQLTDDAVDEELGDLYGK